MKRIFMRYPQGAAKALTFSYDDGVEQDKRLVSLFKQHGVKGTFNLSTHLFGRSHSLWPFQRWMTGEEQVALFAGSGMEVAAHSHTHPELPMLDNPTVLWEILRNRQQLEAMFDTPVHGLAYPQGAYDDRVVRLLYDAGIYYARTAHLSGNGFAQPGDWLRWIPTCHHGHHTLPGLARDFVERQPDGHAFLFCVWGHSYEFDAQNNWSIMENLLETVSGRKDIWYATNIEICRYTKAFGSLEYSTDGSMVTNPTAWPVWFCRGGSIYCVESGATLFI